MTDQLPRTIPTDPDEQEAQMPEWALSEAWKRNSARSLVGASVRYTIEHHPSVFDHALTIWQYMPEPVDPDLQMAREVCAEVFPQGKDWHMRGDYGMHGSMNGMMFGISGKQGDEFDKAFLSEMVIHHEGAVIMAEDVLATSKRPELLTLAKDIISAQTKEINQMKTWYKKWYGVELTK